jgi:Matrixin
MHRKNPLALFGSLLLGLSLLVSASTTAAFCRSTTCSDGNCPRDESGCKTTGQPLFWPGRCVGFSLQREGTENLPLALVRPSIQAGFIAWSDLDCSGAGDGSATSSLAFSELDDVSCRQAEYRAPGPNANIILFQDTKWRYTGPNDTLAKTTVSYDPKTGRILDADIEVNHAYNEITIASDHAVYDLQSIITHEIGHFIGLDHSSDASATMSASYDQGSTSLRTLESDDIAGACAIYPPDRPAVACSPTPAGGLADRCLTGAVASSGGCSSAASEPTGGPAGVVLSLIVAGLLRRRATRAAARR